MIKTYLINVWTYDATPFSEIITQGIQEVRFKSNSTFKLASLHQNGFYRSDMMPPAIVEYKSIYDRSSLKGILQYF